MDVCEEKFLTIPQFPFTNPKYGEQTVVLY